MQEISLATAGPAMNHCVPRRQEAEISCIWHPGGAT